MSLDSVPPESGAGSVVSDDGLVSIEAKEELSSELVSRLVLSKSDDAPKSPPMLSDMGQPPAE